MELDVQATRRRDFFWRICIFILLIGCSSGHAGALRFPQTGKHTFDIDLPKGWQTKTDARAGLLLIPPAQRQHAMIYLGILIDETLRGEPDQAVAAELGKTAGIKSFDKQEPARITDIRGAIHRGTAFYGRIPAKRGLSRKAKIVIVPLESNTWAHLWTVTQFGIDPIEYQALDRVLNNITLRSLD